MAASSTAARTFRLREIRCSSSFGASRARLEEPVAEPELLRHRRAALARHDVGADLREPPFRGRAETIEHRARDRELEDAVAQELQTLVRRRPVVRPRGVREDLLQPVGGELRDQAAELVHPGRCV